MIKGTFEITRKMDKLSFTHINEICYIKEHLFLSKYVLSRVVLI